MLSLSAMLNNNLLILLFVISLAKADDFTERLKQDCRFHGDMCGINATCIMTLRRHWLIENCDTLVEQPTKSLYLKESLSFQPHPFTIDHSLAKDWKYSVFIGDNYGGDNLQLVPDCCNLGAHDACMMPATFNKTKKFIVVFPYEKSKRKMYCQSFVDYQDAPLDFCEEGKEIIDPCIYVADGTEFRIKYRYMPLDQENESVSLETDRCYFTLPNDIMPLNTTYASGIFTANDDQFIFMTSSTTAVVRNTTKYQCKLHHKVTTKSNAEIAPRVWEKSVGDYVCFGVKPSLSTEYFKKTYCTKLNSSPLSPMITVVIPVIIAALLLSFLASIICFRFRQKNGKVKKGGKSKSLTEQVSTQKSDQLENKEILLSNGTISKEEH